MPIRRVSELMNAEVRTLRPEWTLREAERFLAEHRIAGAPVVDARGRLLGVVSQSDLVRGRARPPSTAAVGAFFTDVDEYREIGALPADEALILVEQLMTRELVAIGPDASPAEAARVMRRHRVHRLLVTEHGELRGVLSPFDLLRALEDGA
jgi:CBS domain-containing protein